MARRLAWGFTNVSQVFTSGLRVSNNLLLDLEGMDTITVARLVINLRAFNELGEFLIGVQALDMGIGVASVEAFAVANSVGLPNPAVSDQIPPRGWLWSDSLTIFRDEGTTNAQFIYNMPEVRADIRAMRKVDRGVLYLTVSSNNKFGVAQGMILSGRIAALCMT